MRRLFNQRMYDYLAKHGEEHTIKEWLEIVSDKFEEEFTLKELQRYFVRHHLPVKYECPNKRNHALSHPIGSERTKPDGMVQIKVGPHKWEYKQRYLYEQYYNIELPDDVYVIFLDQNRNNFDISNLKAISRRDCAIMKANGWFSKDKDCTETGIMLAELDKKIKDRCYKEKKKKNDKKGR